MVSYIVSILKTPKQSSPLYIRLWYQLSISNLVSLKPNSSPIHAHLGECLIHPSKCLGQKLLIHTGHHDSNPINPNVESPLFITPWFQVTIFSAGLTQQPPNWSPHYYSCSVTTSVLHTSYGHSDPVKAEVKSCLST